MINKIIEGIAKLASRAKFALFPLDSIFRKVTYPIGLGHRHFTKNRIQRKKRKFGSEWSFAIPSIFRPFFVALTLFLGVCLWVAAYEVEDQPLALQRLSFLSQKGILKEKSNGYLYLDVSDEYIVQAIDLIDVPGKMLPSRDYTKQNGIGAHISVIFENERCREQIYEVLEVGQEFSFSIKELGTLQARNDRDKIWVLAIDAPELEALRKSYGLPPLARDQDFHITIGLEVRKNFFSP